MLENGASPTAIWLTVAQRSSPATFGLPRKTFGCKSQHKSAIYFDNEKAFDKVPHTILVENLQQVSIYTNQQVEVETSSMY